MADEEARVFNGRYELHRRIARGGMADVYLARDLLLDRPVALKVLFPEFSTDASFVERFRREAQSAGNLSQANIVSVYDWGEENGTYFIVMEYVEGRSLAQILRDEGPLLPDRAADITIDIAAALGFAHRNGVIHRDVKPGNVLLSPLGQVKVTDFGIARAVSTQDDLTQTGTVMGTATYFSPEQARGEKVDPRSDVYSLGIVLYELLVGEPPFKGDNPVSVAYKHVQETPDRPSRRNPQIPAPLESVVMKALAKNPANRYASADDLAADLRRFRQGQPVLAESMLPDDQHTQAVTAATVASAAAGATRAVPQVGDTRVVSVQEPYYDDPPKRSATFVVVLVVALIAVVVLLALLARNLGFGDSTEKVAVPGVVDLTVEEATTTLEDAGFEVTVRQELDEAKPEGIVLRQDPEEGTEIDEGGDVTIFANSGRPPVEVPDVVGLQEAEADRRLRDAGLVAQFESKADDDAPEGEVLSQDPEDGEIPRGSVVKLVVSSGAGEASVPDVTGLSESAAANRLGRDGFETEVESESSSSVTEGQVVRTDPPAGTALQKGEVVTIFVSTGAATATVPSVLDLTPELATRELEGAGFEVERLNRNTTKGEEIGLVLDQTPDAGSTAPEGSTVTIFIGRLANGGSSTTTSTTTSAPATTTTTAAAP